MKIIKNISEETKIVLDAKFDGEWEFPIVANQEITLPLDIVPFEKRKKVKKENKKTTYIHFYMQDDKIKRFLNNLNKYVKDLKQYGGVISPDPSLYLDVPLVKSLEHTYKNRACAYYLQKKGLNVIPNVRWADERSFKFCFDGLIPKGIYAISTHGCIKSDEEKKLFKEGLKKMLITLRPKTIILHGPMPNSVFAEYKTHVKFIHFDSWIKRVHEKKMNKLSLNIR